MKTATFYRLVGRLALTIVTVLVTLNPTLAKPDLDVVYISRTPRYQRYLSLEIPNANPDDYGNTQPTLNAEELAKQRWPNPGETVTFTAVVKNPGDEPTGSFNYKWYFDGVEVASGTLPSIDPKGETSTSWQWTWDSVWNDHYVKFEVDTENIIEENIECNNFREDRTNALCYKIPVWQSVYDWFDENINSINPNLASFEDWIQMQLGYMNQLFKDAIWPTSPNGILERVRLDVVEILPQDAPLSQINHDPDFYGNLYWDGVWGFGYDEYPRIFVDEGHTEFLTGPYTWDLHEWGHQLGLVDMYRMDSDSYGNTVMPYGHNGTNQCMMSGNDMQYSSETAAAMNSMLHRRCGLFGEYLYDVPQTCSIRVLDAYGNPVPNATVNFYQNHDNYFTAPPTFTGVTDENGCYTMPNRYCWAWDGLNNCLAEDHTNTTITGHILHDNPWGQIALTAYNATFFCEVTTQSGETDYQFFEIVPFNLAYWMGNFNSYTYDLRTVLVNQRPTSNDLYGIKMTSVDHGYAVGANGTILQWDGSKWNAMSCSVSSALRAVDAQTADGIACAVGDGGVVLINSNGSWTESDAGTTANLNTCVVLSEAILYVGGNDGLYCSIDGGTTWNEIGDFTGVRSLRFCDESHAVIGCDYGYVYYTEDCGSTWQAATGDVEYTSATITGCSFPALDEAYVCNNDGKAFKSSDGGKTWVRFQNGCWIDDWNVIDMKPGGVGWISGGERDYYDRALLSRWEPGLRYMIEAVSGFGPQNEIYGLSCISADEAWVVGKAGLIFQVKPQWPAALSDDSPPTIGSVIDEGDTTYDLSALRAYWTASDLESAIAGYEYAIGLTPGDPGTGYVKDWTSTGARPSVEVTDLNLVPDQTYYFYVKAINHVGLWSDIACSDGITVLQDTTPPVMGPVTVVDGFINVRITFRWSATDPETGIAEYMYAVGTSPTDPGSGYVRDWTSTGLFQNVIIRGLNVEADQTYYVYVKARNNQGLWSDAAVSEGLVPGEVPETIGQIKLMTVPGDPVLVSGVICTGRPVNSTGFFVQEPDRSAGILVCTNTGDTYPVGTIMDIVGDFAGNPENGDDQTMIYNSDVSIVGTTTVFPLELKNSALGGGDMGGQQALWGWRWVKEPGSLTYEYKWLPGFGLNNVGLLVKTTGKVTCIDPDGGSAYIDDGSRVDDGNFLGPDWTSVKGIKVLLYNAGDFLKVPPVGTQITVTGISNTGWSNGSVVSVLKPRSQDDIGGLAGAIISGKLTKTVTTYETITSPHPCPADYYNYWSIAGPEDSDKIRLHFDWIQISSSDYLYYGNAGDWSNLSDIDKEMWTDWMKGNRVDLVLSCYGESYCYGFTIDRYETAVPLAGGTVTLMPGEITTTTDSNGYFIFTNLAPGTYTITPSSPEGVFNPVNRSADVGPCEFKPEMDFSKN